MRYLINGRSESPVRVYYDPDGKNFEVEGIDMKRWADGYINDRPAMPGLRKGVRMRITKNGLAEVLGAMVLLSLLYIVAVIVFCL